MVRWKIVFACQALFIALYVMIAPMVMYAIGPDGAAYVQQADFFAHGDFWQAASGYWSPLLPALSAPMISLGLDPVVAFRIAQGIFGVGYVAAAIWGTTKIFSIEARGQWIIGLITSITAAVWSGALTTPDVALACFLLLYFPFSASDKLLTDWRHAALAGVLGAIAFLAKAYAFPFFLAHFTFCVAVRWLADRHETAFWRACASWGLGIAAFAIVCGPWIGALSTKYGRFTFSNSGAFNHYQVGIQDFDWKVVWKLQMADDGRYNIWETPERLDFTDWSPIESKENFLRQAQHIRENGKKILGGFWTFDPIGLFPAMIVIAGFTVCVFGDKRAKFGAVWMILTCGIYAGGFLPVAFEPRYMAPVLLPLCVAQLWSFIEWLMTVEVERPSLSWTRRWAPIALAAYLVVGCCARPGFFFLRDAFNERGSGRVIRHYANLLADKQFSGPVALIGDRWQDALLISYYSRVPFLGKSYAADWNEAEQEFDAFGVQTLIVDSRDPLSKEITSRGDWELIAESPVLDYELRTYRKVEKKAPEVTATSSVRPDAGS
ncbi:hypothetical protein LOC68_06415 [Blastopirellula sp. JC732]|uniref:Glycosyltransferase RgtA/B/C/D-like domain-containing protein n=1 Tax=Blastopirellula sediminis TaxID=2894196 RepID=A0A9X1MKK9_9BACT|nr:hypothetical protein [Blastopirellula sediminis]MCC9609201.1 hypothetical protein [Blastopirellula sediminis]MCC9628022.1 hypothetical protein [Blastopirellula sediminis]